MISPSIPPCRSALQALHGLTFLICIPHTCRSTLQGALEEFTRREPRGEMCIVVQGLPRGRLPEVEGILQWVPPAPEPHGGGSC